MTTSATGAAAAETARNLPWGERPVCSTPGCNWRINPITGRCVSCDTRENREARRQVHNAAPCPPSEAWDPAMRRGVLELYLDEVLGVVGEPAAKRQRGWERMLERIVEKLQLGGRQLGAAPGDCFYLVKDEIERRRAERAAAAAATATAGGH